LVTATTLDGITLVRAAVHVAAVLQLAFALHPAKSWLIAGMKTYRHFSCSSRGMPSKD